VAIDQGRNQRPSRDRDIAVADASVRTLVIAAGEDLEVAAETEAMLREAHT
jgi:hypothetical protein